jgi:hypothetical protein
LYLLVVLRRVVEDLEEGEYMKLEWKVELVMCGLRLGLKARAWAGLWRLGLHKIVSPAQSPKVGLAGPGSGSSLGFYVGHVSHFC